MELNDITKKLLRLHGDREPLNLAAAKRNQPELVEAVYKLWPFLGWRGAIEAAGLRYGDLLVELLETTPCRLCGAGFKGIFRHVSCKHELTWAEYQEIFPGEQAYSEDLRARRCRFAHSELPHWERHWSKEYVLDRIHGWYEAGYPMNIQAMLTRDTTLVSAIKHYLGVSYDKALARTGLDPNSIRLLHFWDREKIIAAAQDRHRRGLPFQAEYGKRNRADRELEAFHYAARRYFGGMEEALKAAGINPESAGIRLVLTGNPQAVIDDLRNRLAQGLPMNCTAVSLDNPSLVRAAKASFKGWKAALSAAGIDHLEIWKSSKRQQAFVERQALEFSLEEMREWALTILNRHGQLLCDKIVNEPGNRFAMKRIRERFGSWTSFLKDSVVAKALQDAWEKHYPTQQSVAEAIAARHRCGLPMDYQSLNRGGNADEAALLRRAIEFYSSWTAAKMAVNADDKWKDRLSRDRYFTEEEALEGIRDRFRTGRDIRLAPLRKEDPTLAYSALLFFGNWRAVMRATGLGVLDKPWGKERFPDKETVLESIRERVRKGWPIHRAALEQRRLTEYPPGDKVLFRRGMALFGSWPAVLRAVGLVESVAR